MLLNQIIVVAAKSLLFRKSLDFTVLILLKLLYENAN